MTGAPRPASLRGPQPREWAIQCPGCRALPGRPCTTPRGKRLGAGSHPSRLDAWIAQQVTAADRAREAS